MSGLTFIDNDFQLHKNGENATNFQSARQDVGSVADKQFYAWLAADGSYIIMERNSADVNDTTTLYFHSKNSLNGTVFQTDWDNRATLVFGEYNALFA